MNCKSFKKYIVQTLIYLFEIIIVLIVFNYILAYYFPIENFFEYINRSLGIYTIYQIFVYSTLRLANDAQKDAYSTLKSMNEEALLIINYFGNDYATYFISRTILKNHIKLQIHESVFNMEEVKTQYAKLIGDIDNKNIFSIELNIININHHLNYLDQEFLLSFLLRAVKGSLPSHAKQYLNIYNAERYNDKTL